MPDPIMYREDAYVVLEPGQPEQFLTTAELFDRLKALLSGRQDELPRDLQKFSNLDEQTKYLLETSCEFELEPGRSLQWYVVRLEK